MAQKLSFYCELPTVFELMERYGEILEDMAFDSLLTLQSVVATYTLYYQFEGNDEHPELTFRIVEQAVAPTWKEKDPAVYQLCKAFCTDTVDGKHISPPYLVPIQKGLADCIQCHRDY